MNPFHQQPSLQSHTPQDNNKDYLCVDFHKVTMFKALLQCTGHISLTKILKTGKVERLQI